jgi:hypothetical protein
MALNLTPDTTAMRARVERGTRAETLRQDPVLLDLLNALIAEGVRMWREGDTADVREQAWQDVRAIDRLRAALASAADDGKAAKHQLERSLARMQ